MPSVGVDISDTTIKFVELVRTKKGIQVGRFGSKKIAEGIVVAGKIVDPDALIAELTELREENNLQFVRASLPEEQGYLFEASLPADVTNVHQAIEFVLEENVPLTPEEAVIGYDLIEDSRALVSVFPGSAAERYTRLLHAAGLVPLSLEIEPQAIARAVLRPDQKGSTCIVDFGRQRTGIAMTLGQHVKFATTITAGGDAVSEAILAAAPDTDPKNIATIKNEKGVAFLKQYGVEAMAPINALAAELLRYIAYWNTLEDTVAKKQKPITKVILCGGNGNMAGLPELLTKELKIKVERANVWTNILDIKKETPAIHLRESLGLAPAIGLALRGISSTDSLFFT